MTLTAELNEKLSRVGPGTPCGDLMRRYWHPIAATAEIATGPTKRVRILGEDLVLYRDLSGQLGLVEEPCAHRRVSLYYGIPEADGIRCPYHGWLYDESGQCIEQPAEPPASNFKEKVRITAYPVQEMGGLIWAYLGPQPVPLLPRYDEFVWEDAVRSISAAVIPVNWLQVMENSLDATHVEWLHGYYAGYVRAVESGEPFDRAAAARRHHTRIGFDVWEHGIVKRRIESGGTEADDDWRIGHTIVFPYTLGNPTLQIRVPVDDTHTWHIWYTATRPGVPVPPQDPVPFMEMPWLKDNGDVITNFVDGQDIMAWVTQGDIARRELEKLGQSDVGIILFRQLLEEQIDKVARGEEPMNVIRDPAKNTIIELPRERVHHGAGRTQFVRQVETTPNGTDGNRVGGRPTPSQARELLRQLRVEAASKGIEPVDYPAFEVPTSRGVTADLA